jgi:hypothetical protein
MSSIARLVGASTAGCSQNEASARINTLSNSLMIVIENYVASTRSEITNNKSLASDFDNSANLVTQAMILKELLISDVRLRMYDLVTDVIKENRRSTDDLATADCITKRILSSGQGFSGAEVAESVKDFANTSKEYISSIVDVLDDRLAEYDHTLEFIVDYHH